MPNAQAPGSPSSSSPANPSTYSPSVPISLYRQLATELQSAQTSLESLTLQNKHLTEQNQHLRLEIERVVQSALHLRQLADSHPSSEPVAEPKPSSDLEIHFEKPPAAPKAKPAPRKPPAKSEELKPFVPSEQHFTEQDSKPHRPKSAEKSSEVGGLWLVLVIFLIVVTAFGTGFLIVRPLLPNR